LDKNEPFYVGIGSDDAYKRAHNTKNRNKHWKNIAYLTAYEVEIVLDNLSWEDACKKEREFIALYGRKDQCKGTLCNYTDGGEGVLGLQFSAESLDKMRKAQTGKVQSLEQIAKRVAKLTGPGNPWYGKKLSEEHKLKLSKAKKGKKRNSEVMKRLHKALQKSVLDLQTGQVYNSIGELAEKFNVHGSTAGRWVRSKSSKFKVIK
jgi:hypothetical protein